MQGRQMAKKSKVKTKRVAKKLRLCEVCGADILDSNRRCYECRLGFVADDPIYSVDIASERDLTRA